MKKLHIIGLILIAFAIAGIAISASNYTSYEGFTKANEHDGKVYKIVGNLDVDGEMNYEPEVNPNLFSFYMSDKEGISQQVIYADAKPQDFERSEQLVITGKSEDGVFYADQILMKCPSKYVEDEIEYVEANATASQ
ncbi:MAG: cytochrome c-type biogenesis protein CcmE [Chitinophagales bacterium]|jgi:cytochrome c-type biogenesis protein CcmE